MRTLLVATTVGLIAAVGVSAIAVAGGQPGQTVKIETKVKLRNKAPAFHGRVTAKNENCVEQRRVKLFKEKRSGATKLLGKTTAGDDGKWTIPVDPLKSGTYFAKSPRVSQGTAGTIYVCLKDESVRVNVD